jgi:drug/metabolite transporter (DMT)-like permease
MAGKRKQPTWLVAFYILGMLVTGTMNTLSTKIQFTMKSVGIEGQVETFQKPWFGTLNMMAAMFIVGLVDKLVRCCSSRSNGTGKEPLMAIDGAPSSSSIVTGVSYERKVLLVAVPAAFDLVATALSCIGILFIPASAWQMIRGSCIIFAALFSIIFLKRRMYCSNWLGLFLCVLGVAAVGVANILGSSEGGSDAGPKSGPEPYAIGMALVLLGQVVQAAQIIAEEFLMKKVDLPAMQIIGFEGFWGTLLMIGVVYPVLYSIPGHDCGHLEDPFDTLTMIGNSRPLICMVCLYLFSCGTFNATGIAVTQVLTGVHRMQLDASRTILIWGFGLFVHYGVDPDSPFGEVWTSYSYLQLVGFAILVSGQATYGGLLRWPGVRYPPEEVAAVDSYRSPAASLHLASPGLGTGGPEAGAISIEAF